MIPLAEADSLALGGLGGDQNQNEKHPRKKSQTMVNIEVRKHSILALLFWVQLRWLKHTKLITKTIFFYTSTTWNVVCM